MQFKTKHIIVISYLIAGAIWCILHLPNVMARAKGNAIFAAGLSITRILLWPALVYITVRSKEKSLDGDVNDIVKGESNESSKTSD